jgi:hypothetical protein
VSRNVSNQVLTETCRNCDVVPRLGTSKVSSGSLDSTLKANGLPEGSSVLLFVSSEIFLAYLVEVSCKFFAD